jgi:hypothetical protein
MNSPKRICAKEKAESLKITFFNGLESLAKRESTNFLQQM